MKQKLQWKRGLALLLCLVLCLGALPGKVHSEESIDSTTDVSELNKDYAFLDIERIPFAFVEEEYTPRRGGEDYRAWAQADSRWGGINMGYSGSTVAQIGCTITSVTKLIIQSGFCSPETFNVGTLVNWLNNNGGFTSGGALYWAKPSSMIQGFENYGDLLDWNSGPYSSSTYCNQILSWINSGLHLTICVNGGGHWVAVDEEKSLATGQVYIMDSLSNSQNADITLSSRYSDFSQIHAYTGSGSVHTHTYERGYEAVHPHKVYMKCSCGDWYYTGETEVMQGCSQCVCSLEVQGIIGGTYCSSLLDYGTFDVYINNSLVADDTNYYPGSQFPAGTTFEIADIKPLSGNTFNGVYSGSRTGTLTGNETVFLDFTRINTSGISDPATTITYKGTQYVFYDTNVTWYTAKQFCEEHGGHLAVITSDEENTEVRNIVGDNVVWLGGTKASGNWEWITGEAFTYGTTGNTYPWNPTEPNNFASDEGGENYLQFAGSLWNDNAGCYKCGFVLETDIISALDYEYAWFPAPVMNLSQIAYEAWTGSGTNTGASHGECNAIDILPGGNVIAPFTGKIIYKDADWGYVILVSSDLDGNPKKVYYADGRLDYMSVAFMHDNDISDLYVGQVVTQGTPFYQAGGMGNGTPDLYGAHVDISVFGKQLTAPPSRYGRGDTYAYDAFYYNPNITATVYNPGRMENGNYITNGGFSDWSNLWRNLSNTATEHYLDVNGLLDGSNCGGLLDYGSFDVYINGSKVADDVDDFYLQYPEGTAYEITDLKSTDGHRYVEVVEGQLYGTIMGDTIVRLAFNTKNDYSVLYHSPGGALWKEDIAEFGIDYTILPIYPKTADSYFSGWSYTEEADAPDLFPGEAVSILRNTHLYPIYVSHERAVSGDKVLIFEESLDDTSGYTVNSVQEVLTVRRDASFWSDWSAYSLDAVSTSETTKIRITPIYRYYYYLCPSCGAHEPFWGTSDCGAQIPSDAFHILWSVIPYASSNYQGISYTSKKFSSMYLGDDQLWFFSSGNVNDTAIGTRDADGTDAVILEGYSFSSLVENYTTTQKTVTMYQLLKESTFTNVVVAFSSNGGTGSMSPVTVESGAAYTLPANGFTAPAGKEFKTWSVNGTDYAPGQSITVTANTTVLAVWKDAAPSVDPTAPQIVIENRRVTQGETFTVAVLLKNNPGIAGFNLQVSYDPAYLELLDKAAGDFSGLQYSRLDENPFRINWDGGTEDYTGTTAVTLSFRAKDGAEGSTELGLSFGNGELPYNTQLTDVPFTAVGGTVEIQAYIPGDANGDKTVSMKDSTIIRQHLAGWPVQLVEAAADANGDGSITMKDSTIIRQYLAGWPVTLGGSGTRGNAADGQGTLMGERSAPQIVIEDLKAASGDTITVPVLLKGNPGIAGFDLAVSYDTAALTLTGVADGDFAGVQYYQLGAVPFQFNWDGGTEENTGAVAALLSFRVKEGFTGSTEITVAINHNTLPYNAALEDIAFDVRSGSLTVGSGAAIRTVSFRNGSVSVDLVCEAENAELYCAAYNAKGQMLALQSTAVSGSRTYSFSFDETEIRYVKTFLLDSTSKPLCDSMRS